MPNVISDSSGLIVLDNIHMTFILKALYGKIHITEEVYHEFGKEVESWFEIQQSRIWWSKKHLPTLQSYIRINLFINFQGKGFYHIVIFVQICTILAGAQSELLRGIAPTLRGRTAQ